MSTIGVFGGTFDPVHYGHLRTAFEMLEALDFDQVRFIPSGDPPHRGATFASAELRLEMVRAAVRAQPGFVVDERELHRPGPSYTFDTLTELRAEYRDRPLGLILGMDAFLGLPGWHCWDKLLDLAHIIVAHRPGWTAPEQGPLGEMMSNHGTRRESDLQTSTHGRLHVHAVTQLEISATDIRDLIAAGNDPRFLLPDSVRDLIVGSRCYEHLPE